MISRVFQKALFRKFDIVARTHCGQIPNMEAAKSLMADHCDPWIARLRAGPARSPTILAATDALEGV